MDYQEYISLFDSDSEDENDRAIEQLRYNAYFDEYEEDDWVMVLPNFKPYSVSDITPVPYKRRVNPLENHDQVVRPMNEIARKIKDIVVTERRLARVAARNRRNSNNPPKERSRASETSENKEPGIDEKDNHKSKGRKKNRYRCKHGRRISPEEPESTGSDGEK